MLFKPLEDEPLKRPDRPLGVLLLTAWDGVFFGIIPVLSTVFGIIRSGATGTIPITIYITTILSVLIISTALGTYAGNDRARSALIYIIAIYQCLQAFNSVILISSGTLPAVDLIFAIGQIFAAVFWIALHAWYFLRPQTMEFYRRPVARPEQGR